MVKLHTLPVGFTFFSAYTPQHLPPCSDQNPRRSMAPKSSLMLIPQLGRLTSTELNVSLLDMLVAEPKIKRIHKSRTTSVYTASLRSNADTVVLKMATHAEAVGRLKHEHEIYCKLQTMQGDQIPHCFGLFLPREDGIVSRQLPGACLLLEYCGQTGQAPQLGEPYETVSVSQMPWKFR